MRKKATPGDQALQGSASALSTGQIGTSHRLGFIVFERLEMDFGALVARERQVRSIPLVGVVGRD